MIALYHAVISTPLLNVLVGLYQTVAFQDLGIAIAVLTIIVRLAFYPLFQKGLEQQAKMQELQPKIKALQAKHKGKHEEHSKALIALYKEHDFNPFSSIIMMVIQIPILIALYYLFLGIFNEGALQGVYYFIPNPGTLNHLSLGFLDLTQPYLPLVLLTAALQFVQARLAMRGMQQADRAQRLTSQAIMFVAPLITILIFRSLPAAVAMYWLVTSLLSVGQQYLVFYRRSKKQAAA